MATAFFVTGGMGFIGSRIVRYLNQHDQYNIVVCDHLTKSSKWENLEGLKFTDLVDVDDLGQALTSKTYEVIFHMGARSDTRETDLRLLYDLNFRTSKTIFEEAYRQHARLIYASSAATYGDGSSGWSDTLPPDALSPRNAYGFYKNLFDLWVSQQGHHLPQCVGVKFFNVYGPGEAHKGRMASAIYHFLKELERGEPLKLFKSLRSDISDGFQRRDFIWIEDVLQVIDYLLHADSIVDGVVNAGSGVASAFLDVVCALESAMGQSVQVEFVDLPQEIAAGYQYFSQASHDRLRKSGLCFTSLESGVAAYHAGLKARRP